MSYKNEIRRNSFEPARFCLSFRLSGKAGLHRLSNSYSFSPFLIFTLPFLNSTHCKLHSCQGIFYITQPIF